VKKLAPKTRKTAGLSRQNPDAMAIGHALAMQKSTAFPKTRRTARAELLEALELDTVTGVANRLGVGRSTVYRWIAILEADQ